MMNKFRIITMVFFCICISIVAFSQFTDTIPKTGLPEKKIEFQNGSKQFTVNTIQVNSTKISCVAGIMNKKCFQIKRNPKQKNWEILYEDILGFEPVEGYIYQIKVKIEQMDISNLADASSERYTLIKILSKKKDSLYVPSKENSFFNKKAP